MFGRATIRLGIVPHSSVTNLLLPVRCIVHCTPGILGLKVQKGECLQKVCYWIKEVG